VTWLVTPDACWLSEALCVSRLAAALDTSPASVLAEERTSSRRELSPGSTSSDEKELKRPVISLPMSPALEELEPESGVKTACNEFKAVKRALEADASCCC